MIIGDKEYDHIEVYDKTGGLIMVLSDDEENIIKDGYNVQLFESINMFKNGESWE